MLKAYSWKIFELKSKFECVNYTNSRHFYVQTYLLAFQIFDRLERNA